MGGTDADRIDRIVETVRGAVADVPRFDVPLDTLGAFPGPRRPRVAWLGPRQTPAAFASLCGAVRVALEPLGFRPDDRADAHVTLARADGRTTLPSLAPPRTAVLHIDVLTLFSSNPVAGGVVYRPLAELPLGKA